MLDLETLGNGPNAAITSIGAVKFNLEDEETYESINADPARLFFRRVRLDSLQGDIEGPTIEWWMKQSDVARKQFLTTAEHVPTRAGLIHFIDFYYHQTNLGHREVNIWGNGATFDNVIITSALKRCDVHKPWSYRADKDVRTIKYLAELKDSNFNFSYPANTTAHIAIDDAINQVLMVQHCWRILNDKPSGIID